MMRRPATSQRLGTSDSTRGTASQAATSGVYCVSFGFSSGFFPNPKKRAILPITSASAAS